MQSLVQFLPAGHVGYLHIPWPQLAPLMSAFVSVSLFATLCLYMSFDFDAPFLSFLLKILIAVSMAKDGGRGDLQSSAQRSSLQDSHKAWSDHPLH